MNVKCAIHGMFIVAFVLVPVFKVLYTLGVKKYIGPMNTIKDARSSISLGTQK